MAFFIVGGMVGLWTTYQIYDCKKTIDRIYEDFAEDVDRLEEDIKKSGNVNMLKAFKEVKKERTFTK